MKRGSADSRQFHGSSENSKISLRYNTLLEDYLDLQKEYVSKNKKLQLEKHKREILLDEVRFLRQRHKYLRKSQLAKVELKLGPEQNVDIHNAPIGKERNQIVKQTNMEQEGNGKEKLVWKTPITEKPLNFSVARKVERGKNHGKIR